MATPKRLDGSRLKQIREARMMTAKKLSNESGVSTATISRIEHGGDMTLDVAEKLAKALDATVSVLAGSRTELDTPAYFRSITSATKTARNAQRARSEMANALLDFIEEYLDVPIFALKGLCDFSDINAITVDVIEDVALQVRDVMKLGLGPIANLATAAEANGIVLTMSPFSVETLDGLSRMGDIGRPIVFVNTDKGTAYRWRFDLAHEIGHMVLHQCLQDISVNEPNVYKVLEQQANYFSGAFLMPEETFVRSLPGLGINDFLSVKSYWGVSLQAMLYRARNIGILDESQYTARQVTVSKKRWRSHEPLDDQRLPERPSLLKTCASMCVEECGLTVQQLMDAAGIPKDIFEDLVGVRRGYVDSGGFDSKYLKGVGKKDVIEFPDLGLQLYR